MLFFFKKKTIVVDCFTDRTYVHDYAKIDYAIKFIPEWWKKLPATHCAPGDITDLPTMKTCSGFVEQYKKGFIIPMWSDCAIEVGPVGEPKHTIRWAFSDGMTNAVAHPPYQRGSYCSSSDYEHLKINSPWFLECKNDIRFQFLQPIYNFQNPEKAIILPGIIDYRFQYGTSINIMFRKTEKYEKYKFSHGQPMAHIVPISENKIVLKHHVISKEEMINRFDKGKFARLSFRNNHALVKRLSKCPFHKN